MEKECKKCNGTGTYVEEKMQVIGMDVDYEWVFDINVDCGCQNFDWTCIE